MLFFKVASLYVKYQGFEATMNLSFVRIRHGIMLSLSNLSGAWPVVCVCTMCVCVIRDENVAGTHLSMASHLHTYLRHLRLHLHVPFT